MFNKLKTGVGDLAGKASELKSIGGDIIQTTAAEFNAVRPLFGRVGYHVGKVQIEIGLSPKINFQLRHVADADDAAFDALLAEHQGNRVLSTIVAALRQASVLQAKVKFQGMRFAEVEVEIGIPPAIKLTFREEGEVDSSPALVIPATNTQPAPAVLPAPPPQTQATAPPDTQADSLPLVPAFDPAPLKGEPAPALAESAATAPASEDRGRQREEEVEALIRAGVAVRFTCLGCGKVLLVRAQYAGREGECRRCGTVHIIPEPSR